MMTYQNFNNEYTLTPCLYMVVIEHSKTLFCVVNYIKQIMN